MSNDINFNEFGLTPPTENSDDFIQKFIAVAGKLVSLKTGTAWIEGIEVLGQFITPQLEKSRREWEFQVFCALKELNKRQERILERLYGDAEFQTLLRQAFFIAWKTHKSDKFKALKAGIMNSALNGNTSFDKKEIYLRLIDDLTATHLVVLNFIYDFQNRITAVDSFEKYYNILNNGTIDKTLPVIDSTIELSTFRAIMRDLEIRGLILISSELTDIDGVKKKGGSILRESDDTENDKLPYVTVTKHGQEFLSFIKEPE
jgi:hypothetical protein